MNDAPEVELEQALVELEALASKQGRRPGRWEARSLLVPLGRLILARGEAALADSLARAHKATAAFPDAWTAAVDEELALACAEHVQGTDPRYMELANFDWDYVLSARERLEARVVGARALGRTPTEALWSQVLEADGRVRDRAPRA